MQTIDLNLLETLAFAAALVGGHGTAAAYASSFATSRNLQGALELGMVVRNVAPLFRVRHINDSAVQAFGSVALSLFLIRALMSMRILDLATLAGPLLLGCRARGRSLASRFRCMTAQCRTSNGSLRPAPQKHRLDRSKSRKKLAF